MLNKNNDTKKIQYLRIKKENGQVLIRLIKSEFKNKSIIDKKKKVLHEEQFILFPLIENKDLIDNLITIIEKKIKFDLVHKKGIFNQKFKYKSLKEALKNNIPKKFINFIPKSYDIIGNIAIIEFDKFKTHENEEQYFLKKKIAKTIIKVNKKINSVYEKKSEISGKYRLRKLDLLYGNDISETIYKENHCSFNLDIKHTFFTPRLVYERRRIASSNIKKNEIIIDLFAGVGPFSIQIAKDHDVKIYSFDINPYAYYYLKENIKLNKLKGKINAYNLDIKILLNSSNELGKSLKNNADRIIMNLPERSIKFIDIACFLIKKSGGILHFYQFCEKPNPIEKALEDLTHHINYYNWKVQEILNSKIVKAYSPKSDMVVLDLVIKSQ